ncbi:MAG: hypothetical protein HQK65_13445 [Desulfamplus sp.]|nr:hypothetical protein [Desulfamplus sp.]
MGTKKKKSRKTKKKKAGINQDKYRHLKMKVRERINTQKIEFIDNPDEIKMSAVLFKLAEPYIEMFREDEDRIHSIISLTSIVWNMSFLSEEKQNELQQKCVDEILPKDCDAQDVAGMLHMFDDLKERKEKLFPNIRVYIMGHDLRMDKNNIHLDVSSVPLNDKK